MVTPACTGQTAPDLPALLIAESMAPKGVGFVASIPMQIADLARPPALASAPTQRLVATIQMSSYVARNK